MPNQSFILLKSKNKIISLLPNDSTPLLKHCLEIISPMRTFEQMCVENGLTFDEMVKIVKHLIFWDLGKIIYPITSSSVFMLTAQVEKID